MQTKRGFVGVGALVAIIVGLAVLGGGAYYVVQQNSSSQVASENSDGLGQLPTKAGDSQQTQPVADTSKLPTKIVFTSPTVGSVLKVGSVYTAKWMGQANSDQTMVTLKATDPGCWNVGLVAEGERGCSATELGKVKIAEGSFEINLKSGVSPLSQLSNRDSKTDYVLFFDAPSGRVTSQSFTVQGSDFVLIPSIEKTLFTPGETVRFSVRGVADTGETLSPELGFSAKVFLEWGDRGVAGSAIYHEGLYNKTQKQWDFVTTAPMTPKNGSDYRVFLYVKCSNQNVCVNRYPNLLEKETLLKFNVSQN